MKTRAVVIALDGDYATVETERTSACEGCHKAEEGGCSVCSLMASNRKLATRAKNTVGAAVGDTVTVESETARLLWYAALVFLLPILVAALAWCVTLLLDANIAWQIAGAVIGFVGTFVGIFFYSKHLKKTHCDVEIIEIVTD